MNFETRLRSGAEHQDALAPSGAAGGKALSLAQIFPRLAQYRTALIIALALFLVWEIVTRSFTAYLAHENPELAVGLRYNQPTALVKLADLRLNPELKAQEQTNEAGAKAKEPADADAAAAETDSAGTEFLSSGKLAQPELEQIRTWAELALRNDPLNARALRILGQVAHQRSNEQLADALMEAAAKRSLHEGIANYWSLLKTFREGDYESTLRYADILLRTRHQVRPYVNPVVARLAETPGISQRVKQLLAENPPWRSQFLSDLPRSIADARTPLDIFLTLKDTPYPPLPPELKAYLEFLVQKGFHELAYYAWLQFLPPEQLSKVSRLFNGSFHYAPSGLPFDWVFREGSGTTIQVTERLDAEDDNALLIEFGPGRVEFDGVTQFVLLPAGSYQLRGKHKAELVSTRGMKWRILCGNNAIGESAAVIGTDPAWEEFVVSFTVPEECPLQTIKLVLDARSASETFVSGSVWYDDLSITRDALAEHSAP